MKLLNLVVIDALRNEPQPLIGLIDYLLTEKGYSETRLLTFAIKAMHLPPRFAFEMLSNLVYKPV